VASLWLADKMSKYTILLVHLVSPTGGYILLGPENFPGVQNLEYG
jgi:hypothetical protein